MYDFYMIYQTVDLRKPKTKLSIRAWRIYPPGGVESMTSDEIFKAECIPKVKLAHTICKLP